MWIFGICGPAGHVTNSTPTFTHHSNPRRMFCEVLSFLHVFVAQAQSSFSWDWGPSFPGAALWKGVRLEAFDLLRLVHLAALPLYGTPPPVRLVVFVTKAFIQNMNVI